MRIYLALFAAAVAATAAPNNPVEAGTDLFCYDGHQLPSLFVIGAPKCGTTSLFGELIANWEFRAYTFPGKRYPPSSSASQVGARRRARAPLRTST